MNSMQALGVNMLGSLKISVYKNFARPWYSECAALTGWLLIILIYGERTSRQAIFFSKS